jgi:hypothetical protein
MVFFLSSCKRAGEDGVTRVSLTIPAATFVTEARHAAMSVNSASWNSALTPADLNEINCYVIFIETPGAESTPNLCTDTSGATVINYHQVAGGIIASSTAQTIQLEVPTGAKRKFSVVGMKASSANLATACIDFKKSGVNKSLFSQPLIIGTQTQDLALETEKVTIQTSLTAAPNVDSCEGILDVTPPAPSLSLTDLALTPAGPSNQSSPTVTGNLSGVYPIQLSLHSVQGCTDSAYSSNQSIPSASSFSLALAPAISGDGAYSVYVKAVDAANNSSCAGPVTYTFDSTAPALAISQASFTAASPPTFSGTCENGLNVAMSGSSTGNFMCAGGTWNFTAGNQGTDGTYNYNFAQTDLAGNASSVSGAWTRDTVPPTITISGSSSVTATSPPTFSGTCRTGLAISISGADSSSASCPAGSWTYTVSAKGDGNYSYTFSQTSAGGLTGSTSATWLRDTTPPVATSFSAVQASPVTDPRLSINFQASDATQVSEYCIQMTTTPPLSGDSCWKPLPTPGPSPTVSAEPFLASLIPNANNYYLFLKDSSGNMSSLSASGVGTAGIDKLNMNYTPSAPPVVLKLLVGNADAMYANASELSAASGVTVYVRWKITSSVSPSSISLDYTTNDMTWTSLATGLSNGANGCTVNGPGPADDDATGCATVNAPSSSYFRLRIRAAYNGFYGGAYSQSLNVNSYRELAGRPGSGLDFDGSQLKVGTIAHSGFQTDNDALAVDSEGAIYIRDEKLGIVQIPSSTRIANLYIPMTGTTTGNGGLATSATLRHPFKIALDAQDNLYIYDYNVIRKVTRATGIIQNLIGGGADATLVAKPATSLQLAFGGNPMTDSYVQAMPFIVLGNGDVIFEDQYRFAYSASTQNYFWYYDHANGNVFPQLLSGTGYTANASESIASCNAYRLAAQYDPKANAIAGYVGVLASSNGFCGTTDAVRLNTSYVSTGPQPPTMPAGSYGNLVTGLDGNIYAYEGTTGRIYRFNWSANTWNLIAGTGILGICADGTAALSCAMSPTNVTVDRLGHIYFSEGGRIRTIENGFIRTIYGLPSDFGDGGSGLMAQFNKLMDIGFWDNGSARGIVAYDAANKSFREIDYSTSVISKIAGNNTTNSPTLGGSALSSGLGFINWEKTFAVDPSTGDVFWKTTASAGQLIRLDRATGNWVAVVGGGGIDYFTSGDGIIGPNINFNYGNQQPILFAGSLLFGHVSNSSHQDVAVKSYDPFSSYTQTNVVSLAGAFSASCSSVSTSCGTNFPANGSLRVSFNPNLAKLLFATSGSAAIKYESAGSIFTFTTALQGIGAFAYRYYGGYDYIYYCSSSGTMIKRNVSLSSESAITLPTGVLCTGSKVEINNNDSTVIFITVKNGNFGIATAPL